VWGGGKGKKNGILPMKRKGRRWGAFRGEGNTILEIKKKKKKVKLRKGARCGRGEKVKGFTENRFKGGGQLNII